MVTINRYIKALLHPAGGHQGSHKAHQAGNQRSVQRCIDQYVSNKAFISSLCSEHIVVGQFGAAE